MNSPALVLLVLDLILLFMGCFMGGTSILLLMMPVLINLSLSMGFDLLHLGVVLVLTTMIGGTTPPMAPALFTTCKCCDVTFEQALRPTLYLLIPLFVTLAILTFIPRNGDLPPQADGRVLILAGGRPPVKNKKGVIPLKKFVTLVLSVALVCCLFAAPAQAAKVLKLATPPRRTSWAPYAWKSSATS